jgi:hypothetical protein
MNGVECERARGDRLEWTQREERVGRGLNLFKTSWE